MAAPSIRILLVEDYPDYRKLLVRALSSFGHEVLAADSVAAAKKLAAENAFDLVLCDFRLEDGHGSDLMKDLKTRYGLRGICLSGYEEDDLSSEGPITEFEQFLVKGVDIEVIQTAIEKFVASQRKAQSAKKPRKDLPAQDQP